MTTLRIAELLEAEMGLHPASIGFAGVDRAVAERVRALGLAGADAYWDALHSRPGERQALIEAVVIPETWFFRDPAAFGAMAREAMARSGPLRILSLPCSTGEEPYTIAMALLDAGLPVDRLRIDAIDISARALDLARLGLYGRNSFRGADLSFRDRHFTVEGRDWRLRDTPRQAVTFAQGNVIAPDFLAGAVPYDIIFCRNLLIYFNPATQQRVANVLARLLRPDGVLFAGHSEAGVMSAHGFASAQISMAFAFRHAAVRVDKTLPMPPRPVRPARAPRLVAPPRIRPVPTRQPTLDDVWTLVNGGRLEEARQACESHMRMQGPSVDGYLLLALISDAQGDDAAAAGHYRRVLYLDPGHGEALDHLALLMRKQGDDTGARRLADRARRQGGRAS
jgi:chemotaxis protein methyltransferase WspC